MKTKKISEKSLSRSNTWNNLRRKLKILGGASALSILITLNSCGPDDIDVKKAADKYQAKTENVAKTEKELEKLKIEKENIDKEIEAKEKEVETAKTEEQTAEEELEKETEKLKKN